MAVLSKATPRNVCSGLREKPFQLVHGETTKALQILRKDAIDCRREESQGEKVVKFCTEEVLPGPRPLSCAL
jgi:hypothetical protein